MTWMKQDEALREIRNAEGQNRPARLEAALLTA